MLKRNLPFSTSISDKYLFEFTLHEYCLIYYWYFQVPGDIEVTISKQKQKASVKKTTVQPYIIIEGPSLTEIRNVYVIMDKIKYHYQSLVQALDICFKCFHVFNVEYPPQSEHIWILIAKGIYRLPEEKNEKTFPYIMDVINYFDSPEM